MKLHTNNKTSLFLQVIFIYLSLFFIFTGFDLSIIGDSRQIHFGWFLVILGILTGLMVVGLRYNLKHTLKGKKGDFSEISREDNRPD
jgi:hypothetical protein